MMKGVMMLESYWYLYCVIKLYSKFTNKPAIYIYKQTLTGLQSCNFWIQPLVFGFHVLKFCTHRLIEHLQLLDLVNCRLCTMNIVHREQCNKKPGWNVVAFWNWFFILIKGRIIRFPFIYRSTWHIRATLVFLS